MSALGASESPRFKVFEALKEQGKALTFAEILEIQNWQPVSAAIFSGGYSANAHWLKLTIDNAPANDALILTVLFATHDDLRLYIPDNLVEKSARVAPIETGITGWKYWQQGDLFPFNQRELNWRGFSFALHSPDNMPHTVYLRLDSEESHLIFPQIWRTVEFWEYQKNENGVFFFVISWMSFFLFLAILSWLFTSKAALQRYYLLLSIAGIFYFLSAGGFFAQWFVLLPPEITSQAVAVITAFLQISIIAVIRELLLGSQRYSLLYWAYSGFMLMGFITAGFAITGHYNEILEEIFVLNNLMSIISGAVLSFFMWRNNMLSFWTFAVCVILLVNYFIPIIGFLGTTVSPWISLYGIEIGIFFNLIILLFVTVYDAYRNIVAQQKTLYLADLQAQATQSQRYWLTMVTHEIKTPLAIIHSSCQNIEMLSVDPLIQSRVDKIQRSTLRIDKLIHRFLRNDEILSRLQHLQRTSIQLKYWLPEQLQLFDELSQTRWDVKIKSDLTVWVDSSLLAIALNNLLTNSLKYSDMGSTIEITVDISDFKHKKGCLFSVRDYGKPIDEEKQDYLFERYQFNEYAGNGVGLWACREIVRAHNGDVWLEKIDNTGNIFNIWLPLQEKV
jgi:signal transduction histidine kinase